MTHMLDSDWLKNPLLRSDWSGPSVALYTTLVRLILKNIYIYTIYINE